MVITCCLLQGRDQSKNEYYTNSVLPVTDRQITQVGMRPWIIDLYEGVMHKPMDSPSTDRMPTGLCTTLFYVDKWIGYPQPS